MADIELSSLAADSIDLANDYFWFVDVSEAPDAINKISPASLLGQNLVDIRSLTDPGADSILFWDDSDGAYKHLGIGSGLSITGTTLAATGGGGGSPGGSDTQVQFNDGGAFGGDSGMTFNKTTNTLAVDRVASNTLVNSGVSGSIIAYIAATGVFIQENLGVDTYINYTGGDVIFGLFPKASNKKFQFVNDGSAKVGLSLKLAASQSADAFEILNSGGSLLMGIDALGAIKPASMANSSAPNNSIFFSTTNSKLVYKDSGGTVNNLY
jgi:hypothetical protein